jgi:hypothetical protein
MQYAMQPRVCTCIYAVKEEKKMETSGKRKEACGKWLEGEKTKGSVVFLPEPHSGSHCSALLALWPVHALSAPR